MNFLKVLGDPERLKAVIDGLILSGNDITYVKRTYNNATYVIGYFSVSPAGGCFLLLEDGSKLLLESGDRITLEICINYLIMEDGSFLLLEDGSKILLEQQE